MEDIMDQTEKTTEQKGLDELTPEELASLLENLEPPTEWA
jgi:hypothetical protein